MELKIIYSILMLKLIVDIAAGAEDNALVFSMACDRSL